MFGEITEITHHLHIVQYALGRTASQHFGANKVH